MSLRPELLCRRVRGPLHLIITPLSLLLERPHLQPYLEGLICHRHREGRPNTGTYGSHLSCESPQVPVGVPTRDTANFLFCETSFFSDVDLHM